MNSRVAKTPNKLITNKQKSNNYNSLLIVFFIPILLYIQTLTFGYVKFDDNVIIQSNASFLNDINNLPKLFFTDAFLNGSSEFYRPLQSVSYMFSMIISGDKNPIMFHLTNLVLLGFISCSLFILLVKLSIPKKISLFGTLIFSVHPLFVSNIAWIPALGDLFLCLFSLLSFIFLLNYLENNKISHLIGHWFMFTLALFSKETAVLLPLIFVIYYILFVRKNEFKIKHLTLLVLYLSSGIVWLWFRSKAISSNFVSGNEISFIPEFSLAFIFKLQTIPESLFAFFIPFNIVELPDFSIIKSIIGVLILIALMVLLIRKKRNSKPGKLFGLLWFIILLLPALLFNKDVYFDYLNHRFLLPQIGILIFVLLSLPIKWIDQTQHKISFVYILIIAVLSSFTYYNTRAYASPIKFYNSAISNNNMSELAYNNRGYILGEEGKFDKAIQDFSKAVEINDSYYEAYFNRALMKNNLNLNSDAINDYTKAIELNPNYYEAYYNRGYIYGTQGLNNKAIADFSKAIDLKPDYAQAINNRGITYLRMGEIEKSCLDFKKATELGSKSAKENLVKYCP